MRITGMKHFEDVCKKKLVSWYLDEKNKKLSMDNVFVVWSCKTLQNYKCLLSTTVPGDGIYVEYTFNGDKRELYEDVYVKISNTCFED